MIRINLLPPELRRPELPVKKLLLMTGVGVALILGSLIAYSSYQGWQYQHQIQAIRNQYQLMLPAQEQMRQANLLQGSIQERNRILQSITQERISWQGILSQLASSTEEGVWLTELSTPERQTIKVKGMALAYPAMGAFYQRLAGGVLFVEPVLVMAEAEQRGRPNTFELNLKLKGR